MPKILQVMIFHGNRDQILVGFADQRNKDLTDYRTHRRANPGLAALANGVHFCDEDRQDTKDAALKVIANGQDMGGVAWAVPFWGEVIESPQKKTRKAKLKRLEASLELFQTKLLKSFQAGKSKLVGCRTCNSKLARAYIKSIICPICNLPMGTVGQLQRLTSLLEDIKGLQQSIQEEPDKPKKGSKLAWAIGGWITQPEEAKADA